MDKAWKFQGTDLLSIGNGVKNTFWVSLSVDNELRNMFCLSLSMDNER